MRHVKAITDDQVPLLMPRKGWHRKRNEKMKRRTEPFKSIVHWLMEINRECRVTQSLVNKAHDGF